MQDVEHPNEQEYFFVRCVKELEEVNEALEKLTFRKECLTKSIIEVLDHKYEGQKSYQYGDWSIEIRTPFIYSLDKKKYLSGKFQLPSDFNPIKESISYTIDKRLFDKFIQEAPEDIFNTLNELIDKRPRKTSVTIKGRV